MRKAWETEDCGAINTYLPYYTIPQAAMLWCDVPIEQMDEELARARPLSESSEWESMCSHILLFLASRSVAGRCNRQLITASYRSGETVARRFL